jgi:SnoaL-like polyketide cyclase
MSPVELSDLQTRRDAVVTAHIEAEAVQHDVAAVVATFKKPHYEVPSLGGVFDGATAVDGLIHSLLEGFPDFWLKEIRRHHAGAAVIVECVFGGTQMGVFAGIAPTQRKMEVASALVFEFDGDGLVGERVYFDLATVLRQLGVIA